MTRKPSKTTVRTPDIVRERIILDKASYGLSYRKLSVTEPYSGIPAGTLCAIANGYPIPHKWHAHFGLPVMLPAPACPRCGLVHVTKRCTALQNYRDLLAIPPDELRWRLENREEL